MSDLIKKVIARYADSADGFSSDDCAKLMVEEELTKGQCDALMGALGRGREGAISPSDIKDLGKAGFKDSFIEDITDPDNMRALRVRGRWLTGYYIKCERPGEGERAAVADEIMEMAEATDLSYGMKEDKKDKAVKNQARAIGRIMDNEGTDDAVRAARIAQGMGQEALLALPALVRMLQREKGDEAKIAAIRALGAIGEPKMAAPALSDVLRNGAHEVQIEAAQALGKIGDGKTMAMKKVITYYLTLGWQSLHPKDDAVVRDEIKKSFDLLGVKEEDFISTLTSIVRGEEGESVDVRGQAAAALGRLGAKAATSMGELVKLLSDKDSWLRYCGAYALLHIKTKASLDALKAPDITEIDDALMEEGLKKKLLMIESGAKLPENEIKVMRAAAWLLGERKCSDAAPLLRSIVDDERLDAKLREYAASALGSVGAKGSLSELIAALDDENVEVAVSAARSLGRMGDKARKAIPALVRAYYKDGVPLKVACIKALGSVGRKTKKVLEVLVDGLCDPSEDVLVASAEALFKLDPARAAKEIMPLGEAAAPLKDLLVKKLKSKDEKEVRAAALCLGSMGKAAEEAVAPLVGAMNAGGKYVKKTTIYALGKLGAIAKDAALSVSFILADQKQDDGVRVAAAEALVKFVPASNDGVPALLAALEDGSKKVQSAARKALESIGHEKLVPALLMTMQGDDDVAAADAMEYLVGMGPEAKDAIPTLLTMLDMGSDLQKQVAARALGSIGAESPEVVPALLAALGDRSPEVVKAAGQALSALGASMLIEPLSATLMDVSQPMEVRVKAAKGLGSIAASNDAAVVKLAEAMVVSDTALRQEIFSTLWKLGERVEVAEGVLVGMLASSTDQTILRGALHLVNRAGPVSSEAVMPLLSFMGHYDESVRQIASEAIGKMDADVALPVLCKAIVESGASADLVKQNAIYLIWNMGSEAKGAIRTLLTVVRDDNENVRIMADEAIRRTGASDLIKILKRCLKDEDVVVRRAAVYYLWTLGSKARPAVKALRRALKDEDQEVRELAKIALAKIKP